MHDKLNDQEIDWEPEQHGKDYKAGHRDFGDGVVEWDGLLLDGGRLARMVRRAKATPQPGDWIIKGAAEDYAVCRPDALAANHEPA